MERSGSDLVGAHGTFSFHLGDERHASLAALGRGRSLRYDAKALAASALVRPPSRPTETPYADIEARYVGADLADAPPRPPTDPDRGPAFVRAALDGVIDRLLAGKRRVAVLAGGGVDSSALLALCSAWARRAGASVVAVALDFEGEGDDRPYLRAVEGHLGCEVVRVRPEDAAERMALVLDGADGAPFAWCTGPCEVELLARARASGAECVVTGVGGDELFDGEPRSLARLLRAGMPLRAFSAARAMQGFDRPRWPVLSWLLRPLAVELVPRAIRARRAAALNAAPDWAGPTLRAVVDDQGRGRAASAHADPRSRFEEMTRRSHRMSLAWLRHQESRAAGIERIDPYLDLDLVRAVTSLPPEWLVRGARRRGLLRDALGADLPRVTRERMDKASFEPALERFVAAARSFDLLRPHARGEHLAALGVVEPRLFAEAATAFLDRPEPEAWVTVWPALACEAFVARRDGFA